jgi:hypothetical protein
MDGRGICGGQVVVEVWDEFAVGVDCVSWL